MNGLWKQSSRWRGGLLALLAAGVLWGLPVFPWGALYSRFDEVDTHSGRVRHGVLVFGMRFGERIEPTWISRNSSGAIGDPEWRRVNTFPLGTGHSPHYVYHGAIGQMKRLWMLDDLVKFEPAARRRAADEVLMLWGRGSYWAAEEYLTELEAIVIGLEREGVERVLVEDLP